MSGQRSFLPERLSGARTDAAPRTPAEAALAERVLSERVDMLFDRNRMPALTVVPFAVVICWFLWDLSPHAPLLTWLGIKTVVSLLMIAADFGYRRRASARSPARWLRTYLLLLVLDGASWSLMGSWFMPVGRPDIVAVMFAAVAGVGAVGGVALASFVEATAAFSASLLLPVISWHLLHPSQIGVFASIGALFYLGLLISNGNLAARATLELIRLRFDLGTVAEQRAEALEAAERHSAVKSQFLATMSHEMRTPLHGILGTISLMRGKTRPPEDQERLELVERSGQHLLGLINDVLDFSRMEAGQATLVDQTFDLTVLLQDVVRLSRAVAEAKGLALETDVDVPQPWIRGDATRLRQVLHNLVGNAVKFTDRGQVSLRARVIGDRLAIEVRDTGIGIAPQDLARVFEPFQQADNSYARRYTGTGLGLTISKELARAMGGDVSAQSEPGHGSIFTLELPWQPSVPPRPDNRPAKTAVTQSLRGRVLLAEDNPVNVLVARAMLEGFGLDVAVAVNGELAVENYRANRPDIVLMDCHMPLVDGFEATRRIREIEVNRPGARVIIIAVTANALQEDRERCLAAGMDDYLAKPFSADDLRSILERHLPQGAARAA